MTYYQFRSKYGIEYGQGEGESLEEVMYPRRRPNIAPVTHSMTKREADERYPDLMKTRDPRLKPKRDKRLPKDNDNSKEKSSCNQGFCK